MLKWAVTGRDKEGLSDNEEDDNDLRIRNDSNTKKDYRRRSYHLGTDTSQNKDFHDSHPINDDILVEYNEHVTLRRKTYTNNSRRESITSFDSGIVSPSSQTSNLPLVPIIIVTPPGQSPAKSSKIKPLQAHKPSSPRSSDCFQTISTSSVSLSSKPAPVFFDTNDNSLTRPQSRAPPLEDNSEFKMASPLPDITTTTFIGTERETLGPEVQWEQEDLTMSQVADIDNFPCICYFEEKPQEKDGEWEFLSAGLKIYSRQPVLMNMHVQKKQARARTIYKDPKGAHYEVGQTMIIPGDYQGWFELVPSDFSRATCFMSIAEVARVMPRKFFSRSNLKCIRIDGEGEDQKYMERKIPAGSVLDTIGTFTAKWKTTAESGTFKKKKKEWEFQEVTYLKCLDRDKMEVMVPLTHRGKFNAIYERGQLTQNAVYSMKDILSDLSLPIKVRLLFGKAPVVPCIFTGMLVVRSAAMDDNVVGSTILNTRNVLFELPLHAPVKVKYISTDDDFKEMSTYKDAQKLCKKYACMYSSMIKLSPELDTNQKVIMHVPSDPTVMRKVEDDLRALDLITDISLTGEPVDHLLDSSDSGSLGNEDQPVIPKGGTLDELTEFKSRESQTHV